MDGRRVYLDYNATAPVRPEVRRAVEPVLFGEVGDGLFGNASSVHWAGQSARKALESARTRVAQLVGRRPSEVIFTSGGSEADNLALLGVATSRASRASRAPGGSDRAEVLDRGRVIVSQVEHPAVLAAAAKLEVLGVEVVRIGVDGEGRLDLAALEHALAAPTSLVSIMAVNNETGVCSPIDEIIALAHRHGARVHVDAVQAAGRVPLPLAADLITLSGHKLGALKGVGVLIKKEHVPLDAQIVGGPQERGHRAGTEPVAQAVSFAVALELALATVDAEATRLARMRARLEAALTEIPDARVLGQRAPRVASTTSAVFPGVDGDAVLQALDLEGIAASSGSACSSGSLEPSHVLVAMGVSRKEALSAVRFSMGFATTDADVDRAVAVLPRVVAAARKSYS